MLLKGNIVAARNSLLDFMQFNSWIKKSNFEGIFNAMLVIFLFLLIHKPFGNWIRMGRPFEPELLSRIIDQFENIIIACVYFLIYAMM